MLGCGQALHPEHRGTMFTPATKTARAGKLELSSGACCVG